MRYSCPDKLEQMPEVGPQLMRLSSGQEYIVELHEIEHSVRDAPPSLSGVAKQQRRHE